MFRLRGLEKYLACLSLFNKLLRSVVTGNGIGTMKPKRYSPSELGRDKCVLCSRGEIRLGGDEVTSCGAGFGEEARHQDKCDLRSHCLR